MSRGKYLSLEEARNRKQLDRFAKEHSSKADRDRFERLLDAMSRGALEEAETSHSDRRIGSHASPSSRSTNVSALTVSAVATRGFSSAFSGSAWTENQNCLASA
jgi:hypothetical protein